jgi:hypothetical protein
MDDRLIEFDSVIRRAATIAGFALTFAAFGVIAQTTESEHLAADVSFLDQGWSVADRLTFYTTSQGSHMMPYAWFKALRRLDIDAPFAGDQLKRYGYLANDVSAANPEGLPIGFMIDGSTVSGQIGMTCAACHTSQLEYTRGNTTHALRLDGAPAKADFQQFLSDLTAAARATQSDPNRFGSFAKSVLGTAYTAEAAAQLGRDYGQWVKQFGEFMDKSLPPAPTWGPGRLDAFGMIFNRVIARDLNISANFKIADAPVRYPFLWNATKQDKTQWNGSVPNGLYVQALARNVGEVYGVFADFAPRRLPSLRPTLIDYHINSANFDGLQTLEEKITALKSPKWPREIFPIDDALAAQGEGLFKVSCGGCHEAKDSQILPRHWATPVLAVGTDPKMAANAALLANPGILDGALKPPPAIWSLIANPATKGEILANVVVGSLLAEALRPSISANPLKANGFYRALQSDVDDQFPDKDFGTVLDTQKSNVATSDAMNKIKDFVSEHVSNLFNPPGVEKAAYEARVLNGIWAKGPYLHNGSVPNLWELMKAPKDRSLSFKVGSRIFDPKNVGYDTASSPLINSEYLADPNNSNGNGNGGHDYGGGLTDGERWAIIEYLKTL